MQHERMRFASMNVRELQTRLSKITLTNKLMKFEKVAREYVKSTGNDAYKRLALSAMTKRVQLIMDSGYTSESPVDITQSAVSTQFKDIQEETETPTMPSPPTTQTTNIKMRWVTLNKRLRDGRMEIVEWRGTNTMRGERIARIRKIGHGRQNIITIKVSGVPENSQN